MAFENDTRDIQRPLLKLLVSQPMLLRMYFHSVKVEWFTNKERKFIWGEIVNIYESSKTVLTKTLLEFALTNKIEEKYRDIYMAEWNVINGIVTSESAEALMDALKVHETGQNTVSVIKEAYNAIEQGDVEKAVDILRSKSVLLGTAHGERPSIDITECNDLVTLIKNKRDRPEEFKGIKTGFNKFDNKTGGLFPAELTLISAVTGVGKSTLLKAVGWNIVKQGKNVLHITNEENQDQVRLKYHSLMSEVPYRRLKNPHLNALTDTEIDKYQKTLEKVKNSSSYGKLVIKEIPQFDNAAAIEKEYIELQNKGIRVDVIIVDYLDHMAPIVKAWGENDEQAKAAADLKGLAILCSVPVLAATQAATIAEAKQTKGKKFGKNDVYGSKRKVHATNTLIYIIQNSQDEEQLIEKGGTRKEIYECDWFWTLQIAKNRDGDLFSFDVRQHVEIGKIEQVSADKKSESEENKSESQKIIDEIEGKTKPKLEVQIAPVPPVVQVAAPVLPVKLPEVQIPVQKPITVAKAPMTLAERVLAKKRITEQKDS